MVIVVNVYKQKCSFPENSVYDFPIAKTFKFTILVGVYIILFL